MTLLCLAPVFSVLAVVTLHPNDHHVTNMDGVQIEGQTCASGFGAYANAMSSELYAGGIQYGFEMKATEDLSVIVQPFIGASYTSRAFVPELPNGYQFDTGARMLIKWKHVIGYMGWQHDSNGGLGKKVVDRHRWYGNTGMDFLKFGVGYSFR